MGLTHVKQSSISACKRKEEETIGSQTVLLSTNEIRIEITDICVALRCDNARFIERVEKRYEGFLSTRSPLVTVDVLISERLKGKTSPDMLTSLVGDKVTFVSSETIGHADVQEGIGQLEMTPPFALDGSNTLENFLRVLYSLLCVRNNGFLFHAAGIVKDNKDYIFFGHSGSGKTTVSRLSAAYTILSDDLVIVKAMDGIWKAFGTPFWGDMQEGKRTNESAEIKFFFRLVKDQKVHFEKLDCSGAIAELISSVPVVYKDPTLSEDLIDLCADAARKIACYKMHFLPNNSFWRCVDELA